MRKMVVVATLAMLLLVGMSVLSMDAEASKAEQEGGEHARNDSAAEGTPAEENGGQGNGTAQAILELIFGEDGIFMAGITQSFQEAKMGVIRNIR